MSMARWLAVLLLALTTPLSAHPLAPALLELRETTPGRYDALWRTSVLRVRGTELAPQWPDRCTAEPTAPAVPDGDDALVQRWSVSCSQGLTGAVLGVAGLERGGVNVIVRIEHSGGVTQTLLDAARPSLVVPPAQQGAPTFARYLGLGVEHLLLGLDHVLFVLGLLLLVRGRRALLLTVTAFTLGHSLTLAAAALGVVAVNAALVELAIAASILVLALQLTRPAAAARSWLARRPAAMALGFGLLHGLGFAGALAETGLPADEIPLALLAFNLGIEAGQILLIAGALTAVALLRVPAPRLLALRPVPTYAIGALAAYWCLQRGVALVV